MRSITGSRESRPEGLSAHRELRQDGRPTYGQLKAGEKKKKTNIYVRGAHAPTTAGTYMTHSNMYVCKQRLLAHSDRYTNVWENRGGECFVSIRQRVLMGLTLLPVEILGRIGGRDISVQKTVNCINPERFGHIYFRGSRLAQGKERNMVKRKIRLMAAVLCLAFLAPVEVLASPDDVASVNEMIGSLPEQEDLKEEDAEKVKEAMGLYESLTMAEKVHVEDYKKLSQEYEAFVETGLIRDEKREREAEKERLRKEQESLSLSGERESGATSYVFAISDAEPSLSVVMRYITDKDGDGYGDVPDRIVLTSPSGETTSISNASRTLENESMNIMLTWESKFLQMDIARAENGNWEITTSDPATFSSMSYAGIRQDITAKDEKRKEDASNQPEEEEEPEEKPTGTWRLIVSGILVIAFIVFMIGRRRKKKPEEEDEDDEEYEAPEELTEEERVEQIRQDYQDRKEQERLKEEEEIRAEEEREYNRKKDEAAKESIAEYTEGDTDLLNQKDNPVINGGGLRTDGFFKKGRFD